VRLWALPCGSGFPLILHRHFAFVGVVTNNYRMLFRSPLLVLSPTITDAFFALVGVFRLCWCCHQQLPDAFSPLLVLSPTITGCFYGSGCWCCHQQLPDAFMVAVVGDNTRGVRKIKNPPIMPNLFRHPIRKVTALQVIRLPCTLVT
jgi:hypothetical protein